MRAGALALGLTSVWLYFGCGGQSASDDGSPDAAAGTGGSSGSGGIAGSGGTPGSGGTSGSAGASAGSVPCAAASCSVPDNYCCDSAGPEEECVPATTSSCAGLRRSCDETADCPSGQICCPIPAAANFFVYSTSCSPACDSFFDWQYCATDAECLNGQPCVEQVCNGHQVRTCGPIDPKRC